MSWYFFLETQKEHSVPLYYLSVTTAKPLVCSIFANRHNYLNSKYNLNYAMARTFRVTVRWQMWQCLGIRRNNNWVSQYTGYVYWHIGKIILCGNPRDSFVFQMGIVRLIHFNTNLTTCAMWTNHHALASGAQKSFYVRYYTTSFNGSKV